MHRPALLPSLLLVLGLLGVLAGCGGKDQPAPATGPGLPSQAQLKSYFEAITSSDPDKIAAAETGVAARGSFARGYASYVSEVAVAVAAGGEAIEPVEVREVDGGFKACAGDDQCVTWSHLQGKNGKLAAFSVNQTSLADLLVDLTHQPAIVGDGLYKVRPDWAYRLPLSGTLNVVVTVTAVDVPISVRAGIYVEEQKILKGADPAGPTVIKPGRSSPVVLAFPKAEDAKLDGQVTFDLRLGDDQGSESVGFGLTDPAP